ncbi:hypothetical protein BH10PSE3_BH10PSE3_26340 [soil metagenome]
MVRAATALAATLAADANLEDYLAGAAMKRG